MENNKRDKIYGVLGIFGGLFCAVGDILFDYKGKDNIKTGVIDSNWLQMAEWRFSVSILFVVIGVALYYFGYIGFKNQLKYTSIKISRIFKVISIIGCFGGVFIHSTLCYMPIIYKYIMQTNNTVLANAIINKLFNMIIIPFIFYYLCLIIIPSIIMVIAIIKKYILLPIWCVILNPLMFLIIGILFRKINPILFAELPGIIMPSLGIGCIGLCVLISIRNNGKTIKENDNV